MEQTRHSDEILATAPIGKLILKLAVPSVAAQIINMLYNIVDRIYIGHIPEIGDVALTGVGVTFPIITLISAFAAFAGQGGAPLAAIQLGAKRRVEAQRILGNSLTMLLCAAVVLTVGFSLFQEPILYAFGASDATIGYAKEYISIYLLGTVFVQLALGLNPFISAQGRATTAMLSVLIGAVLNIVLDPIFIFALGMGVRGAALATILSQAVSAAWVVSFLCSRRSSLRLHRVFLIPNKRIIGRIAGLGVAPFIMQSTESLVTVVLNTGMQTYGGDLYVGSITIMQSIMQMIVMPVQGITQGTQPIMSYNYGAQNFRRVRKTFKRLLTITLSVTCAAFPRPAGPDLYPPAPTDRSGLPGDASVFRRHLGLWGADGLSDHLHGSGAGPDQPVSGPAAEGDPAGAPGADPAPGHRERLRHLRRRAHRGRSGQRHHPDSVPHPAEKAAAGGGVNGGSRGGG